MSVYVAVNQLVISCIFGFSYFRRLNLAPLLYLARGFLVVAASLFQFSFHVSSSWRLITSVYVGLLALTFRVLF